MSEPMFSVAECPNAYHPLSAFPPGDTCGLCGHENGADDLTETLAAWKATTDAATEGPWHVIVHENEDGDWDYSDLVHDRITPSGAVWRNQILGYTDLAEEDTEFIAQSRTIVPALLSAVQNVLALCDEHARIEKHNEAIPLNWISDLIAEPTAEQYRKALTDALGDAGDE